MNAYRVKYTWVIDKEEYVSFSGLYLSNEPHNKEIKINWNNLNKIYAKYGLTASFNVWSSKKGKRISFFHGLWDIKEWKEPNFMAILKIEYEKTIVSIDDILKYSDGEKAIQYLAERGVNFINK